MNGANLSQANRPPLCEMLEARLLLTAAGGLEIGPAAGGAGTAEIHGSVWNDIDGDGQKDAGEPGLEGWTIYLDDNQNGQLDPGEPFTTSGFDGGYSFAGLAPGPYTVGQVVPEGSRQTYPTIEQVDLVESGSSPGIASRAEDVSFYWAAVNPEGGGRVDVTMEVVWGWSGGPSLVPELATYTVDGDEIVIELFGEWGIGPWLPMPWSEFQTLTIPDLQAGLYTVFAYLYEGPTGNPSFPTWCVIGELTVVGGDRHYVTLAPGEIAENVDFGAQDTGPPQVVSTVVNRGARQRSTIKELAIQFNEDVSASLEVADLTLYDETHGQAVDISAATLSYDAGTHTATWDLSAVTLADTYLTATLSAAGVTDTLGKPLDGNGDGVGGDDYTYEFHRLAGDATGDAAVNVGDLGVVGYHYGSVGNWWELPGDLNAGGAVDVGDLGILGINYGRYLSRLHVVETIINRGASQRSVIRTVAFRFSGDASVSPDALTIDGVDLSGATFCYDAGSYVAEWELAYWFLGGGFYAGQDPSYYTAALAAEKVIGPSGKPLDGDGDGCAGGDYAHEFFCLAGDANGDAAVNVADMAIVSANLGLFGNWWELSGDLNADCVVDIYDLWMISWIGGQGGSGAGVAAPAGADPVATPASEDFSGVDVPGRGGQGSLDGGLVDALLMQTSVLPPLL